MFVCSACSKQTVWLAGTRQACNGFGYKRIVRELVLPCNNQQAALFLDISLWGASQKW